MKSDSAKSLLRLSFASLAYSFNESLFPIIFGDSSVILIVSEFTVFFGCMVIFEVLNTLLFWGDYCKLESS